MRLGVGSTVRKGLVAIAAGLAVALSWWFLRPQPSLVSSATYVLGCFERGDVACLQAHTLPEEHEALALTDSLFRQMTETAKVALSEWSRVSSVVGAEDKQNGSASAGARYRNQAGQQVEFGIEVVQTAEGPKMRSLSHSVMRAVMLNYPEPAADLPRTVKQNLRYLQFLQHEAPKFRDMGWTGFYAGVDRSHWAWEAYQARTVRVLALLGAEVDAQGKLVKYAPPPLRQVGNPSSPQGGTP
jgi:hypothetical protein